MLFTTQHARTIADLLREAAQAEILPRFRNLNEGAVRQKSSPLDLVTDADEAAERMIAIRLSDAFPTALVVGEEACERDPSLLDGLANADLAFVVDPVDGTKNFAAGLPLFGVMAAVIVRGEVVAGIIHDPIGDDWTMAVRGEGAFTEGLDGRRADICVAPAAPIDQMHGIASWYFLPEPLRTTVAANLPRVAAAGSYRCAAHEYRMAAAGHCHFLLYAKLMPWDHAAGWLIHREAGGYAARFDGSAYLPQHRSGGLLCAPDQDSWWALRDALLGER
jgi:fructose-1,6-bisphosphatase/inositol monophosphatase family enzyme